jgi:hypothetical protein
MLLHVLPSRIFSATVRSIPDSTQNAEPTINKSFPFVHEIVLFDKELCILASSAASAIG